jgi:hypothetical protein
LRDSQCRVLALPIPRRGAAQLEDARLISEQPPNGAHIERPRPSDFLRRQQPLEDTSAARVFVAGWRKAKHSDQDVFVLADHWRADYDMGIVANSPRGVATASPAPRIGHCESADAFSMPDGNTLAKVRACDFQRRRWWDIIGETTHKVYYAHQRGFPLLLKGHDESLPAQGHHSSLSR